jgi:hypothetical protein
VGDAPDARPARAVYSFWQVQQNVRVSHTGMSPFDRRLQILRQSLVDVQVPTDVSGSVHVCIVRGEASAVRAPNPSASATAAAYAPRRAAVSIVFIQDPPVWVDAVSIPSAPHLCIRDASREMERGGWM